MKKPRTDERPKVGGLTVPYMVDVSVTPIDFKRLDHDHLKRCATARRCGICGGKIRTGPLAFIGPDDDRECFAEPWMHPACAHTAMSQCPFLAGKGSPRYDDNPLVAHYSGNMTLYLARDGEAHRDQHGQWHFKAIDLITGES